MNSKERVYAALRHQQPDRVPRFIWLGNGVIRRFTEREGITPLQLDLQMGNDVLQTWVSINGEMERQVPDKTEFVDEWGITWRRDGHYNMVVKHPLQDKSAAYIRDYPFPDPMAPGRYKTLEALQAQYGESHFIGADVSGTLFEPAYHLRGMEDLMMDLFDEGEEATALLDQLETFSTAVAVECARRGVDWVWLGDDLGSQESMLMAPDLWRAHFKPRMRRIIQAVRAVSPRMFIAYHSCGSMAPVIGDLVEIGVDVLNPIQESAAGMDQQAVKQAYGDKLTLMCGLDTQTFLPAATPRQVCDAAEEKVRTLGENGGYVFAVSHHIQHDTPDENIQALLDALGQA